MPVSKGGKSSPLTWANRVKLGGAQNVSGRRQPWCDDTSRMNREVHVRICEGLGVKFPGPTRHQRWFERSKRHSGPILLKKLVARGMLHSAKRRSVRFGVLGAASVIVEILCVRTLQVR